MVDWFAFAIWERGALRRSLSASPDSGILEDVGERLPFEVPYLSGERPAVDPEEEEGYPLPFHPLELGEEALLALFGFQLEGGPGPDPVDPESIPLLRFRRKKKPRWRFW